MTKLTVAFRNFANTPKHIYYFKYRLLYCVYIFAFYCSVSLRMFFFTLQPLCVVCLVYYLYNSIYWLRMVSKFSVYICRLQYLVQHYTTRYRATHTPYFLNFYRRKIIYFIKEISPHYAVNTFHHGCKNHSFNDV